MKDKYKQQALDTSKQVKLYDNKLFAKSPHSNKGYLFVLDKERKPVKAIDVGRQKTIPKSTFKHYSVFVEYLMNKQAA